MIKINLIQEGKRPVAATRKAMPKLALGAGNLGQWLLLAGLVLGIAVFGVWYFLAQRALNTKRAEVAAAQREVDELAQVIKEVEAFKAKKAELEKKIAVINQLKLNQKGPVQIMDQVSRALPELLWLTNMDVTGKTILLRGQAFNTNAVANFIENLDRVPEFSEPVLRDTSERAALYDFQISVGFDLSPPPEPTTTPGAAPAGAPASGAAAAR